MRRKQEPGRSPDASAYRRLYGLARWKRLRRQRLAEEPCCRMCAADGRVTAADTVDHREPHRGDVRLFFDFDNTQSLCSPCHDSRKDAEERRGYLKEVGVDGMPTDPRHPINREASAGITIEDQRVRGKMKMKFTR